MFYRRVRYRRRRRSHPASTQDKKLAKEKILPRVEFFASTYGFEYNRVAFRNQRTRWGSCSNKKNLNFNIRLTQLAEELMDYVIVHELCHTRHMNHSRAFWEEVEAILPDFKQRRNQMRRIRISASGKLMSAEEIQRLKQAAKKSIIRVYTYF